MHLVDLLVQHGFFATGVTVTIDALHVANTLRAALGQGDAPLFRWRVLSGDGGPVQASSGLALQAEGAWAASDAPIVLAFGVGMADAQRIGEGVSRPDGRALTEQLRLAHSRGAEVAASCSSTFFLAEAGLLDGGTATTSWWLAPLFRQRYPRVELRIDAMITEHDRVLCAGAALAQIDLALHLVRRYGGMELARACARYLVIDERRNSQAPYFIIDHLARHDPVVARAETLIRSSLRDGIDIPTLASHCAVSPRTLSRRFTAATGLSPSSFIRRVRAERAADLLLSTDWSISRVATEVGYAEEGALRRAFADHFATSPRRFRARLAPRV